MSLSFHDKEHEERLHELRRNAEESQTKIIARETKTPYLDFRMTPIDPDALAIIPKPQSLTAGVIIFQKHGTKLLTAVLDPRPEETKGILGGLQKKGFELEVFVVSRTAMKRWGWDNYRKEVSLGVAHTGEVDITPATITSLKESLRNIVALRNAWKNAGDKSTTTLVELLLAGSLALEASDIHLEPEEKQTRIRYRIDGSLIDAGILTLRAYQLLKNRLKLVSNLSLNVTEVPQDGRFTIVVETPIEVRVSTLPSSHGEGIVMRVLDPHAISVSLEELGFSKYNYTYAIREIEKPNGMIILTGPTGSGKTTTLYAFIKKLNSPSVKIITIEDPVEYKLDGISQTQVEHEKGMTFASALRSILRQDPDIILVGEIRDNETVETALHAALTGHIVFSTLHTNDAVGAVPRLVDMGAKPAIIAPAVNLIIAQRLVRKVCTKCAVSVRASAEELAMLQAILGNIPEKILKDYPEINDSLTLRHTSPSGCGMCHEGYKGRIGIHELLVLGNAMRGLIVRDPSQYEIEELAKKEGMLSLKQDGYLKVLQGITTLEEVNSTAE